jgi:hypothetical protein
MEQKMIGRCLFEAYGYTVSFDFMKVDAAREYVDTIIEFSLDQELDGILVKSMPTFIAVKDIAKLATYFSDHIQSLIQNPESESLIFVPMELGFQVQALSGDVQSVDEGGFTVRFMVNVGKEPLENLSVYMGGEGVVSVENATKFISSLNAIAGGLTVRHK